jgi:hypothetical protein
VATEPTSAAWCAALADFRAAVGRHNLRELACSPLLFDHFGRCARKRRGPARERAARRAGARRTRAAAGDAARALPDAFASRARARYEQALLGVLRATAGTPDTALDELDTTLTALADGSPYDFWRLGAACLRALRASASPELKRFLARTNLLLREQAQGRREAPPELVRETVALLWRDLALYGAAAEDVALVDVLHDYGLTVDWHVAGTPASKRCGRPAPHVPSTTRSRRRPRACSAS